MNELGVGNSVLYGYTPIWMDDIVNLALTYDKIYDYDGMLESVRREAKALAQHFSGDKLTFEAIKGWHLGDTFLMMTSIAEYHGFGLKNVIVLEPMFARRLPWLDESKSTRRADCERFIRLIDAYFRLLSKHAPIVAERLLSTLSNLYKLFDEGIIIPRETLLAGIKRARKAVISEIREATDRDMDDEDFLALVSWMSTKDNQWWLSFTLNAQLLESSYLGIPLHLWDPDLELVKYKYQRGARYLGVRRTKVIREAFHMFIPEVYTLDISDLLSVRNCAEFSGFRREVDSIYKDVLASPQNFSDANSLSDYLKNEYFLQLEKLALERRPKPGTVLLKKIVSEVHPILGLIVGVKDVYEEYRDKYRSWRLAVSTLELKGRITNLKGSRNR